MSKREAWLALPPKMRDDLGTMFGSGMFNGDIALWKGGEWLYGQKDGEAVPEFKREAWAKVADEIVYTAPFVGPLTEN